MDDRDGECANEAFVVVRRWPDGSQKERMICRLVDVWLAWERRDQMQSKGNDTSA